MTLWKRGRVWRGESERSLGGRRIWIYSTPQVASFFGFHLVDWPWGSWIGYGLHWQSLKQHTLTPNTCTAPAYYPIVVLLLVQPAFRNEEVGQRSGGDHSAHLPSASFLPSLYNLNRLFVISPSLTILRFSSNSVSSSWSPSSSSKTEATVRAKQELLV